MRELTWPRVLSKKGHTLILNDFLITMHIANTIEGIANPYQAAEVALLSAKRHKLSPHLGSLRTNKVRDESYNNRYMSIINSTLVGIEKNRDFSNSCLTPQCQKIAIRNSHCIQKNGPLKRISNTNQMIYQSSLSPFKDDLVKMIHIKSASTFPGFCEACEQTQFAEVEKPNFEISFNNIRKLIFRSSAYNYYRRSIELKIRGLHLSNKEIYDLFNKYKNFEDMINYSLSFKNCMYTYRESKRHFQILRQNPKKSERILIFRTPDIPIVGGGNISIFRGIFGEIIKTPNYKEKSAQLTYTSFSCGRSDFTSLYYDSACPASSKFINQLKQLHTEILGSYLPIIIAGASDTMFVSPSYWDRLATENDKNQIRSAMCLPLLEFPATPPEPISGVHITDVFELRPS